MRLDSDPKLTESNQNSESSIGSGSYPTKRKIGFSVGLKHIQATVWIGFLQAWTRGGDTLSHTSCSEPAVLSKRTLFDLRFLHPMWPNFHSRKMNCRHIGHESKVARHLRPGSLLKMGSLPCLLLIHHCRCLRRIIGPFRWIA
jgi:hypothetical protein